VSLLSQGLSTFPQHFFEHIQRLVRFPHEVQIAFGARGYAERQTMTLRVSYLPHRRLRQARKLLIANRFVASPWMARQLH
jgi:hypothetical protein